MNDQAVTAKLAAALREFDAVTGAGIPADEIADALLPVVREIAADELRAAADELTDRTRSWIPNRLRDRADALAGQTTSPSRP